MPRFVLAPSQRLVFEGDSITSRRQGPTRSTWPYLRLMNWERTWADHAAELLFAWRPELELGFANNAVGGSTCRSVAERIDAVEAVNPDWVLLTTGGNDVRLQIPVAEYATTWRDYARRLHEHGGTRTVCFGAWSWSSDAPGKMRREAIAPYWDALAEIAERDPALDFVDLSDGITARADALQRQWQHHTLFSGEDAHYNALGALVIAGEVLRCFGVVV